MFGTFKLAAKDRGAVSVFAGGKHFQQQGHWHRSTSDHPLPASATAQTITDVADVEVANEAIRTCQLPKP